MLLLRVKEGLLSVDEKLTGFELLYGRTLNGMTPPVDPSSSFRFVVSSSSPAILLFSSFSETGSFLSRSGIRSTGIEVEGAPFRGERERRRSESK